jgi:hypothetical protein
MKTALAGPAVLATSPLKEEKQQHPETIIMRSFAKKPLAHLAGDQKKPA